MALPSAVHGRYAEMVESMTGTRICNQCARRRKAMEARKALLKNRGKKVQAATLGAVLAVTETVGNVFGITGEENQDGRASDSDGSSTGAEGRRDNPDPRDESLFDGWNGGRPNYPD